MARFDLEPTAASGARQINGRPVARDSESEAGARRPLPAADIQKSPVSRDNEAERSEAELERETGSDAPSTNHRVQFTYRLG